MPMFLRLALAVMLWVSAWVPGVVAQERHARIAVLAYRGADKAQALWRPLADVLERRIEGWTFEIIPVSLDGATAALTARRVDFLITNPGHFVTLEARFDLAALATRVTASNSDPDGLIRFGSVILTRAGGDIGFLADLRDKRVAAVSPDAFGGFQTAWREFTNQGIDPFRDFSALVFSGFPQDAIVEAVLAGQADAGIVRTGLIEAMIAEGRVAPDDLRVLNAQASAGFPYLRSTQLYPEWAFAAAPWVPRVLAEAVTGALMTLAGGLPDGDGAGWTAPQSYASSRALIADFGARGEPVASAPRRLEVIAVVLLGLALTGLAAGLVLRAGRGGGRGREHTDSTPEARAARKRLHGLTRRECEVLTLVTQGHSTKEIAARLGIAAKTVEFHRGNLLRKTGARSATELSHLATLAGEPPQAASEAPELASQG
jgi:two-component system, LuxR family, sensor histidine kinase TtrS